MSWLDKVGRKAFDAIDGASRVAETIRHRIDPILEKTPLGDRLRERARLHDIGDVPSPEKNVSPFHAQVSASASQKPMGNPDQPAQLFGRGSDPWTARARLLLGDRGVEHEFTDLEAEGGVSIEAQLVTETRHSTGPWVYLRGEHIGGYNALNEIDRLGQLEELVKRPEDRARGQQRVRIVVGKRGGDDSAPGERGNPDDRQ